MGDIRYFKPVRVVRSGGAPAAAPSQPALAGSPAHSLAGPVRMTVARSATWTATIDLSTKIGSWIRQNRIGPMYLPVAAPGDAAWRTGREHHGLTP